MAHWQLTTPADGPAPVTVTNLKALEPDHRWTMRREHHKSVQS
jgi:hypothetical protein